ncbi:MAG: hypothetical protein M1820_007284 [Bogoriella megaspora]|nr:MAG: hypothetical protein M1820_007284 [Bogoriella megaspora]
MDTVEPFVTHRAPEIDPAYQIAVERINKPPATNEAKTQTTAFKKFITTYTHETSDKAVKKFDIRRQFNWVEVQKEADQAIDEYKKQGRTWRHPFRSLGRSFSNNASSLKQVRERILRCLGSLLEVVSDTKSYVNIYNEDREVRESAEKLYVGILMSVQDMMEWLDTKAYKKTFLALFQQSAYGKTEEDLIRRRIEDKVAAFRERVEVCLHLQTKNIAVDVVESKQSIKTLTDMLVTLVKDREWERQQYLRQRKWSRLCQVVKVKLTVEVDQISRAPSPSPIIMLSQGALQPTPRFIEVEQLKCLLQVSPSTVSRDVDVALCVGHVLQPARQARTAALMNNGRFQDWLKSVQSDILVVNGMESHGDLDNTSPMTYFVGVLYRTLQTLGLAMPLTFFCGQHAALGDPLEGTKGMMRSLIHQLLTYPRDALDHSFINYKLLKAVMAQDVGALCELFRGLLASVDRGAVFCILDGTSWFETSTRVNDLSTAMIFLSGLTEEVAQAKTLTWKVLITNTAASQYADSWFSPHSILTMQEEIEGDGYGVSEIEMMNTSGAARKLHTSQVFLAEDGANNEGTALNAGNFNKTRLITRRERSAATSKDVLSLNQSSSSEGRSNPSNRPLRANLRDSRLSGYRDPRIQGLAGGVFKGGSAQPNVSRSPQSQVRTAPAERSSQSNEARPLARRLLQEPRSGLQEPRRILQAPQNGLRNPPRAPNARDRSSRQSSVNRPARRRRRREEDDHFVTPAGGATTQDLPTKTQARHYLKIAAKEIGTPVPFVPSQVQLQDLISQPMGLYAASQGVIRIAGDEMRASAGTVDAEVGSTTALAARLLEGKNVMFKDESERDDVLQRAQSLAKERAAEHKATLVRKAEAEAKKAQEEDKDKKPVPAKQIPDVVAQQVGFRSIDQGMGGNMIRDALEKAQRSEPRPQSENVTIGTVNRYLGLNGTYSPSSQDSLLKKINELLPVAPKRAQRGA